METIIRDKSIAYILWFFFGFFGFHRMWFKKWLTGLLQFALTVAPCFLVFFSVLGLTLSAMIDSMVGIWTSGGLGLVCVFMWMVVAGWWMLDGILILMWGQRK